MAGVTGCFPTENRLCQQRFTPERDKAARVQILRMQCPKAHNLALSLAQQLGLRGYSYVALIRIMALNFLNDREMPIMARGLVAVDSLTLQPISKLAQLIQIFIRIRQAVLVVGLLVAAVWIADRVMLLKQPFGYLFFKERELSMIFCFLGSFRHGSPPGDRLSISRVLLTRKNMGYSRPGFPGWAVLFVGDLLPVA